MLKPRYKNLDTKGNVLQVFQAVYKKLSRQEGRMNQKIKMNG